MNLGDGKKKAYRKWVARNHDGLVFTSNNDQGEHWPNCELAAHFIWWQDGRNGIEPHVNWDSISIARPTQTADDTSSSSGVTKRQKLSRTTSAVTDSKSVATSASIELSHEISHENRAGTSVEHIKTTTLKLNENTEEKMIEVHTHPSHMLRITHTHTRRACFTHIHRDHLNQWKFERAKRRFSSKK